MSNNPFAGSSDAAQFDESDRIVSVVGELAGGPQLELSNDDSRSLAVIPLVNAVKTYGDGTERTFDETSVNVLYSRQRKNIAEEGEDAEWVPNVVDIDGNFNRPLNTKAMREPWYDVTLPHFKAAGLDFENPASFDDKIGENIAFESQTVERRWANRDGLGDVRTENAILKDEDGQFIREGNQVVYLAEDGTELLYDRDSKSFVLRDTGEETELEPEKVPMTWTGLLPVSS